MSNKPNIPNLPNQKEYKDLTPFDLVLIQKFPFIEEDFDAINIYGIISKIKEHLNIVIANEQIVTENQQNVYNAFTDLHNYVEDYFTNLDVQEEINNKLDEMTESGILQEIITQYLNSKALFGFDTINDLKQATNLSNGSYAKTLGYYSKNDGGMATYKIRTITNNDVVDESSIIALANPQLIAELIIKDDTINIKQFGIQVDGITDCTEKLQNLFNFAIGKYNIEGCVGTACISQPIDIVISNVNNKRINIDFKDLTIKCISSSVIDYVLKITTTLPLRIPGKISNLNINSNGLANIGLNLEYTSQFKISNIEIYSSILAEFQTGNNLLRDTTVVFCENMRFTCGSEYGLNQCANASAMILYTPDCHYTDCVSLGYIEHIINYSTNFFNKIHSWNYKEETIDNSVMFVNHGGQIVATDCYADTLQTMFKCLTRDNNITGSIDCVNPIFFLNSNFYLSTHNDPLPFDVSSEFINNSGRIRVTGGRFQTISSKYDKPLINYIPTDSVQLKVFRLVNSYIGRYKCSRYFMEYSTGNLDIEVNSDEFTSISLYNKKISTLHGLSVILIAGTLTGLNTFDNYVTIGTINDNDFILGNQDSFIGFIRMGSDYIIHPILAKITPNKEIQINVPANLHITGNCNFWLSNQNFILNPLVS